MAASATQKKQSAANGVVTLEQWAGLGVHEITCPTGARVKIRLPDLEALITGDALPEHLRAVAWKEIAEGIISASGEDGENGEAAQASVDPEMAKKGIELRDWFVVQTLVEPEVTMETLHLIPAQDRDLIASIAQRDTNKDARGVTLGVAPLSWFRGLLKGFERTAGCPTCEAVERLFSDDGAGEL